MTVEETLPNEGGILKIFSWMEKWCWWVWNFTQSEIRWTQLELFICEVGGGSAPPPPQVPKIVITSRKSSCYDLTVSISLFGLWFAISCFHLRSTEILCLMQSKKSRRRLRQPSTVPAAYAKVMKKLSFCV
jgi:hypothetical protein